MDFFAMEHLINRNRHSLYGSHKRAFEAGFIDGLQSPLRFFSSYRIPLDAPLSSRKERVGSPRQAFFRAANLFRLSFEASARDVARQSKELKRDSRRA
jgi:hypothetical protein